MGGGQLTGTPKLILLLGLSGSGKTTVLRYITSHYAIDTAPKFTTRESRGTREDTEDFIFCSEGDYPAEDLITFDSYGHKFGIQRERVQYSLAVGRSHAVIVGSEEVVRQLTAEFPQSVVILVHATVAEIMHRIGSDPARRGRLDEIHREAAAFYDSLACVQFVVSTGEGLPATYSAIDRIMEGLSITASSRPRR